MNKTAGPERIPSSFRDPSGYVFWQKGTLYRRVESSYKGEYDLLMSSGLYKELIKEKLLLPHTETKLPGVTGAYKILKPELVPFISYPYEWSFSQLQDAALAILAIQRKAMQRGLSLKDASAYNIQFVDGKPTLIDTLSFEAYPVGKPWIAYRQFCQHFLAPLALMAHLDLRMGSLSERYIDGIPLDLASKLLPSRSRFSVGLGAHVHLHARSQKQRADSGSSVHDFKLGQHQLEALLHNLESTVRALKPARQKTVWGNYYQETNYTDKASRQKEKVISKWITTLKPTRVWDAGANDGSFSRLASTKKIFTVASDIDPKAVDASYRYSRQQKDMYLLPLIIDLTNPSPNLGWNNTERVSFLERAEFDLSLCLAFIHHLAIANNLPLEYVAELFAKRTRHLIIEFVPKEDSNTQRLLAVREDIFPEYTKEGFEAAFAKYFRIVETVSITDSSRLLYLMKRIHA